MKLLRSSAATWSLLKLMWPARCRQPQTHRVSPGIGAVPSSISSTTHLAPRRGEGGRGGRGGGAPGAPLVDGGGVRRGAHEQFRRPVPERHRLARGRRGDGGAGAGGERAGEAEVAELGGAVGEEEHVAALDVHVREAAGMHVVQGREQVAGPGGDELQRQRAAGRGAEGYDGGEVRGGALHDDDEAAVGGAEHGDDVGVRREGRGVRQVAPDAREDLGVVGGGAASLRRGNGEVGGRARLLDGHLAAGGLLRRGVDGGVRAESDEPTDLQGAT